MDLHVPSISVALNISVVLSGCPLNWTEHGVNFRGIQSQ